MSLWLDGAAYTASDILAGRARAQTEAEKLVARFSHDWLAGQQQFAFHTSGSTGEPRAVEFTRGQVLASIRLTRDVFALQPGMNALLCLDVMTVAGRLMLYRAWETGMNLWAVPPRANPLTALPGGTPIDFAALVPYQLQAILQSPERQQLQHIRAAIVGGAPIPDTLVPQLEPLKTRLYATYGMTETLTHVAVRPLNGPQQSDWFMPLPGIEFTLDHRGCLVVCAAHLPSAVITNDLAVLRPDGHFKWVGRADHIINSGGRKISPEPVEQRVAKIFAAHGIANRFFIAGIPHPLLHQQVALVVEGADTGTWLMRVWPALLAALARFERPGAVWQVLKFPETASGKIHRGRSLQSNPQPLPLPEEG